MSVSSTPRRPTAGSAGPSKSTPAAPPFKGKYVSLTIFNRDGTGVATPVWFVSEAGKILIVTDAESCKVRRIRPQSVCHHGRVQRQRAPAQLRSTSTRADTPATRGARCRAAHGPQVPARQDRPGDGGRANALGLRGGRRGVHRAGACARRPPKTAGATPYRPAQMAAGLAMKRIRTSAPGIRRERRWPEDLPDDPRDPDVVRAKALARARPTGSSRTSRAHHRVEPALILTEAIAA